jgi:hypothetical protein
MRERKKGDKKSLMHFQSYTLNKERAGPFFAATPSSLQSAIS